MSHACGIEQRRILTRTKVDAAQWEIDDGRVLLLHEIVFGETLEVKNDVGG